MIGAAIASVLSSAAPVVALVADRIYNGELRQGGALPAVAFFETDGGDTILVHGLPGGIRSPTFSFACLGASSTEARQVAEAVNDAIRAARGRYAGVKILACFRAGGEDVGYAGTEAYQVSLDFTVRHVDE